MVDASGKLGSVNSLTHSKHRFAVIGLSMLSLALLAGCAGLDDSDVQTTGQNRTPEAHLTVSQEEAWTGDELTFDAEGSEDEDGEIVSYRFDFGDGTPPMETSNGETEVTHAYLQGGEYIVTLTVTDNGNDRTGGLTDTATVEVTVNEEVPVTSFIVASSPTGDENATAEHESPFPVYEDADRFEAELEVTGNPLVTGSSEIELKVVDEDGDEVPGAMETITISGTETKQVDLEGLLTEKGTYQVKVTAKSGAATVSGTVKVYYGSEDL